MRLISKSENEPGKPVRMETLPKILFGKAPRVVKGSSWFNHRSNLRKPKMPNVCECCHDLMSYKHRHETYGLYEFNHEYVIKLEDILHICSTCHSKIHYGNSYMRTLKSLMELPEMVPVSSAVFDYKLLWESAKYLLIDDELYEFSEIENAGKTN